MASPSSSRRTTRCGRSVPPWHRWRDRPCSPPPWWSATIIPTTRRPRLPGVGTACCPLRRHPRAERRPAAARRAAIARTDTPLLALLDADDVWLPDRLESLAGLHARFGGIVCADALRWHPGEGIRDETQRDHFPIPPPDQQMLDILRTTSSRSAHCSHASRMRMPVASGTASQARRTGTSGFA